jgi:cyclic beta-1,2-glucan synthetase
MNVQLHERPVPEHEISSDDFGNDISQASMGTRLCAGLHRVFRPRPKPPARSHDEPIRAELFSIERLEQHARSLAAAQPIAPKPTTDRRLEKRLHDNDRALRAAYHATISAIHAERGITPAATWLIDNFHVLEEQVQAIRTDLPPGFHRQLPKLIDGPFKGYPRVFGLAWAFVAHTDSQFDPRMLCRSRMSIHCRSATIKLKHNACQRQTDRTM